MTENDREGDRANPILMALDKALRVQRPLVLSAIRRQRRRRPNESPGAVISSFEKQYLAAMTGTGAAVGGSAAVPGVGTVAAFALSAGESITFLEASGLFSLVLAEIHDISVEDLERRRTLLLGILLGNGGANLIEQTAGRTGKYWGGLIVDKIPMASIKQVNKVLGRWFVTKYGTKQGIIVLGRVIPFGVGAVIGGAGNAFFANTVIRGTRRAFGPPPVDWPSALMSHALEGIDGGDEQLPSKSAGQAVKQARVDGARPRGPLGKYGPLFAALKDSEADVVIFSFDDVAAKVGGLPQTARNQRSWWSNGTGRAHSRSWGEAGYRVVDVDLEKASVTFMR